MKIFQQPQEEWLLYSPWPWPQEPLTRESTARSPGSCSSRHLQTLRVSAGQPRPTIIQFIGRANARKSAQPTSRIRGVR